MRRGGGQTGGDRETTICFRTYISVTGEKEDWSLY